jgi:hypothetical protein
MSHTTEDGNSSFTDDLSDLGSLNYILSFTIINEEDATIEEYLEHDMPSEFPVSLSHNLLDVTLEDVKQFVAIRALKQIMSIFQKDHADIESNNVTLENSDEWLLFEDSDALDSDLETSDPCDEFDEESVEIAEKNANSFEIQTGSNMPLRERIKTEENEIAIEQGKK